MSDETPPTKYERLKAAVDEWTAAYLRTGKAREALVDAEAEERAAMHKLGLIYHEP